MKILATPHLASVRCRTIQWHFTHVEKISFTWHYGMVR